MRGASSNETGVNNGRQVADRVAQWRARLTTYTSGLLAFVTLSGLAAWLAPFSVTTQVTLLLHTIVGVVVLLPCLWYLVRHLLRYARSPLSHNLVLGYVGTAGLVLCLISGVVVTWEAAFGRKLNYTWDTIHLVTTFVAVGFLVPHIVLTILAGRRAREAGAGPQIVQAASHFGKVTLGVTAGSAVLVALLAYAYAPPRLRNSFPQDYSYKYGQGRPFAPSLARTESGGAMDPALLSGSRSCGTAGCHEEIVHEWEGSAHRYAAMDPSFQGVQTAMAKQNGPESTRYCGGCHDPISLFSGTKNLFIPDNELTSLHGFQEGVSCLACHSLRQVDLKGNANYVIAQPRRYMFELENDSHPTTASAFLRDFLIRAYPRPHMEDLSKRLFKTPEYCAACHKQFVDQEINQVGWVQLQNQYDNWRQSRWNHPGDARTTIECRECHMPLVASNDPSAGDDSDYNRTPQDGRHRSHRFIGANKMMPALLKLPGWQTQAALTEKWLQGRYEIPEIAHKWRPGPAVNINLEAPERVLPGQTVPLRVVVTSNKVGHDFPTGPLDIIQAWIEVVVVDEQGRTVFQNGSVDDKQFIHPGTFMFKAEPVDQNGNLIDRHNLWEMVGVRYRRSLFPGFSDNAEYSFTLPAHPGGRQKAAGTGIKAAPGTLLVEARLRYRKVDQYLLNFLFGQGKLTSPITDMTRQTRAILLEGKARTSPPSSRAAGK